MGKLKNKEVEEEKKKYYLVQEMNPTGAEPVG